MISSIFAKELTRIFIALVFFLLIGRITGNWLASFGFVLFVYIIWIYSKLYQINQWIESGLLDSKRPASDGAWERLIFLIHQKDKKSKNRKAKTNTLLKHFQGVVRGLPFATVVLNDMNEIEWANTMSAELLQIKPKTDRGQRIDNLIREPKFHSMLLNKTENEIEITSPFSKEVTLSLRTLPFQTNSTLLVVRDISERTRLVSRQANFVDNASHELKTPLTSIYGYLSILKTSKNINKAEKEMIEDSFEQTESMVELIDDLLFLSRLDSKLMLNSLFETVSMATIINKEADKSSNIDTYSEESLYLQAIKVEMQSLVKNLIENAVKHNPKGTKVEARWFSTDSGNGCLEVRDHGKSIPEEHLERLTDRFYRVNDGDDVPAGSGLGLSIVENIVNRHGASLEIKSEKGFGTMVRVVFLLEHTLKRKT